MFQSIYQGKRVFLTGHTGFKGSWLSEWLLALGAEVHGYALDPAPHEILFDQLNLSSRIASDTRGDLADRRALTAALSTAKPEIVIHLAAQPLVRLSYEIPIETFATNVMGTAHLLESIRTAGQKCAVVCVTTDKCYENKEWLHAYREEDAMGGYDPYSASKGAAELVIASYQNSFFRDGNTVALASARAGNVIGGGDWAQDRIVPDSIRAIRAGTPVPVRNKIATRPWQHVLEPLSGYLWLAAKLCDSQDSKELSSAFNFGPDLSSNRTVSDLVQALIQHTGGEWHDASDSAALHEASKLNLAVDKAFHLLDWRPTWDFEETISQTAAWYLRESSGADLKVVTQDQIEQYQNKAAASGVSWALNTKY